MNADVLTIDKQYSQLPYMSTISIILTVMMKGKMLEHVAFARSLQVFQDNFSSGRCNQ
jgi:hypothetical protein